MCPKWDVGEEVRGTQSGSKVDTGGHQGVGNGLWVSWKTPDEMPDEMKTKESGDKCRIERPERHDPSWS